MAKYRQVHVSFWQDTFVLDLTPEEKYFYLYLMTNTRSSACGIYEIPKKIMEIETGYPQKTVDNLIHRFINYGKIKYSQETSEVFILNWLKYNDIKSINTQKCIEKEISQIKSEEFKGLIRGLQAPYKGLPTPLGEKEKEKEKETEKETDQEKEKESEIIAIAGIEKEFGRLLSPIEIEQIQEWQKTHSDEMIIEALKISVLRGVFKLKYIDAILLDWEKTNTRTAHQVREHEGKRQKSKNKPENTWDTKKTDLDRLYEL